MALRDCVGAVVGYVAYPVWKDLFVRHVGPVEVAYLRLVYPYHDYVDRVPSEARGSFLHFSGHISIGADEMVDVEGVDQPVVDALLGPGDHPFAVFLLDFLHFEAAVEPVRLYLGLYCIAYRLESAAGRIVEDALVRVAF